ALLVPVLGLLFRFNVNKRVEAIILAALVADTGWHRATERADRLRQFRFEWPRLDAALLAAGMPWLALFLVLGGVASLGLSLYRHRAARNRAGGGQAGLAPASSSARATPRPDPSS